MLPSDDAASEQEFTVTVETDGTVGVLRLAGELDMASAGDLKDVFSALTGEAAVIVDMTDVTFMDSSGIAELLQARTRSLAEGWTLTLRGLRGNVRRVLEITGVDTILTVRP